MGTLHAIEYANSGIDISIALTAHLQSNHFPPIPVQFVPLAEKAIELAADASIRYIEGVESDHLWDEEVEFPEGCTVNGRTSAPLGAIVADMHLDAFIDAELHRRGYDDE